MNFESNSIQNAVTRILREMLYLPLSVSTTEESWDKPLTGEHFRLSAVDLTYLLFELEKEFDIRISEKCLVNYGFNTINSIAVALSNVAVDAKQI